MELDVEKRRGPASTTAQLDPTPVVCVCVCVCVCGEECVSENSLSLRLGSWWLG